MWMLCVTSLVSAAAIPDDGGYQPAARGATTQEVPAPSPPPPPPALDGPTAAAGDSLELPADSGTGRRVVYSKIVMRVWAVEEDGTIANTHRVSGRKDQPLPGTYDVYSRSSYTCSNHNPAICMRFMVRFAHSLRGDNIGFHEIPNKNGAPLQTNDQLGQPLSGGCVRQATEDAIWMWNWASIGTKVVVIG